MIEQTLEQEKRIGGYKKKPQRVREGERTRTVFLNSD